MEGRRSQPHKYGAVIFDLGGVVFPSPFEAFDAYDGEPDSVDCRDGNDTVYADRMDTVKNCEAVKNEAAPGSTPPAPRFAMSVTAPSRAGIRAAARGLQIGVRCSERCTATARLFIGARTARRLARRTCRQPRCWSRPVATRSSTSAETR